MEEWSKYIPLILVGALSLIEITPVKINPVSSFLKWAGKQINGDIKDEIKNLSLTVDKNEIDRIRWEILDFANSCRNGRNHAKDEFHHIVEVNQKYHELIQKHDMQNGVLDSEYAYIESVYKECLKKGTL